MAGHARYTAVLDACVLYPVCVADALMSMAVAGLYAAKWTVAIEQEWIRNLERSRPELAGKLDRRRALMRDANPDWEVPEASCIAIAAGLVLPDPDDAHVLAAAIAGHADCIVTYASAQATYRFPTRRAEPQLQIGAQPSIGSKLSMSRLRVVGSRVSTSM
uniref:PIN domain-containing protein n=1 Tax=Aquimonas sp. TaxID=1872588 RepID=UPI0037BF64B8